MLFGFYVRLPFVSIADVVESLLVGSVGKVCTCAVGWVTYL